MTAILCHTVGVEIELLAPPGRNRRQLAEQIARQFGGTVQRFYHLDSEPSKVPGKPVFYHLTQGFQVRDAAGQPLCKCVDDITLQRDLDKQAAPQPGWHRIVSDDTRLLRLLMRHTDADAPLADCLKALGELFGTTPEATPQGIYRLQDSSGASLAMAAPLPGERERACELITAPLPASDRTTLPRLLDGAQQLGFQLPNEGATHLHFDGAPFRSAALLADTLNLLHAQREALRSGCQVNPCCRRLGAWPQTLLDCVNAPDFRTLDWPAARQRLLATTPSKYVDFNIRNLLLEPADKLTLEIRCLPATLNSRFVFAIMAAFQALFAHLHSIQTLEMHNGNRDHPQLPASVVAAFQASADHLAEPAAPAPPLHAALGMPGAG
ncbi:MAG: amidoligase family protein [Thiolinea sp.]